MNNIKMAYQDQLEADKPRQIEFIAGKRTEPKMIGRQKHRAKPILKSFDLQAFGIMREGQTTLEEI